MRPREHHLRLGVAAGILGCALLLGACTRDNAATATPSARAATPSASRSATPSASRAPSASASTSSAPASSAPPAPPASSAPPATAAPSSPAASGQKYVVEPGDTLSAIAEKFGVTMQQIIDANRLQNPDVLLVGQELIIPGR
jgi:LysM repeat protein